MNDRIHHLDGRRQFCIDLESPEEHFDAFEDVNECVLACLSVLSRLRDVIITMAYAKPIRRLHTERRTPTPANMTFAGENTCQTDMSIQISEALVF